MSGGSLNYIYGRVSEAASLVLSHSKKPLHRAFAKHLIKVSKALHDLEWVLSGDYSENGEENSIREIINPTDEINSAIEDAEVVLKNLQDTINRAKNA